MIPNIKVTGGLEFSGRLHGKTADPGPWGTVLKWWEHHYPALPGPQLGLKV